MVKPLVTCVALLAAVTLSVPRAAEASPIMTLRPSTTQSGAAGSTLGWGYDIFNDSNEDLFFDSISASLPLADGAIDLSVFDFFGFQLFVAAHQTLHVDYDRALGIGLVEMTLSSLLSPGQTVTGQVFLDYIMASGTPGSFTLNVNAVVADTTPVPEPATLLLLGTGAAAILGRRRLRNP